jgi:hypothetical protein
MHSFLDLQIKTLPILNSTSLTKYKNKKMDFLIKRTFFKKVLIKHNKEKIL